MISPLASSDGRGRGRRFGRCKIGRSGGCSSSLIGTGDASDGDGERAADEPDMTMLNAEKKREDGLRAGGKATSLGRAAH